jgi:hypothetical protein
LNGLTNFAYTAVSQELVMRLYAFDVDDTLEISNGPVRLADLQALRISGHIVGLCGNWGLFTRSVANWYDYVSFIGPMRLTKSDYLIELRTYVCAESYVMVGNDPRIFGASDDATAARDAGFRFIRESEFAGGVY